MKERNSKTKPKPFTSAAAKTIGDKLGIDWRAIDLKEFCLGLNRERAVGAYNPVTNFASDDPILIGKIVRSHLTKTPDYYTQWAAHEKETALAQQSRKGAIDAQEIHPPEKA